MRIEGEVNAIEYHHTNKGLNKMKMHGFKSISKKCHIQQK